MMMSEEAEQVDFRAVILVKNETLALVGMATTPEGARRAYASTSQRDGKAPGPAAKGTSRT